MKVDLTENALKALQARYLLRDAKGRVIETPEELFRRVARGVAAAETRFGGPEAAARWEEAFAEALARDSDLFELGYEAVGEVDSRLETVADWEEPYRDGVVYYLREGRVRGCCYGTSGSRSTRPEG